MSKHFSGCISATPTCLCNSCQHDSGTCCDDRNKKDMNFDAPDGCGVVSCSEYLKEEEATHE